MNRTKAWDMKTAWAVLWMIFTVALAVWMLVFYVRLFSQIEALPSPEAQGLVRHHRMVVYEMTSMILALLIGAGSLFYLIRLERRRSDQIHRFFAVFSHELKTSLSRLKLRAEGLRDEMPASARPGGLLPLLEDMATLEVQLENSLWVARADDDRMLTENLRLSKLVSEISRHYPLAVHLSSDAGLRVDRRAFDSILKNLLQNSVVHGEAQNFWIDVGEAEAGFLRLQFRDDGRGLTGSADGLGQDFARRASTSGTGLGLYLIRRLTELMGGSCSFVPLTSGFRVDLKLPGSKNGSGA